ncbi:hypothetical protein [Flavobacterium sp.]|uniref:hypothetical protein n=1 Tax=Flavobacterium sp. TaxID=239 RepID=UPI0040471A1C
MKTVNQNQVLNEKIEVLRMKQSKDFEVLKSQFHITLESMKPINLVKETIDDFKNSKEIKSSLLESTLGIAAGYVTRKMIVGKSSSMIKKTAATIIQYLVSNFITKKAGKINSEEKEE